jgi:hypothetical protein
LIDAHQTQYLGARATANPGTEGEWPTSVDEPVIASRARFFAAFAADISFVRFGTNTLDPH